VRRLEGYVLALLSIVGIAALSVAALLASIAMNGLARFTYRAIVVDGRDLGGYLYGFVLFSLAAVLTGALSWGCRRMLRDAAIRGVRRAVGVALAYDITGVVVGVAFVIGGGVMVAVAASASLHAGVVYLESIVVYGIFLAVGFFVSALFLWSARRPPRTSPGMAIRTGEA